jgi:hypothetical protein
MTTNGTFTATPAVKAVHTLNLSCICKISQVGTASTKQKFLLQTTLLG